MSISGALSNALSGLTAASRTTEAISSNIANVMTDGYGRRQVELSSRSLGANGAGVWIDGVTRQVDDAIIANRRLADASLGDTSTRAHFLEQIQDAIGLPGEPGSLGTRLAEFQSSLMEAASRPDSSVRLQKVVRSASSLVDHVNSISDRIQGLRMEADSGIFTLVSRLNDTLRQIEDLNTDIVSLRGAGHDANALIDQRQSLIDSISEIVPLRQIAREHGRIALISEGGETLLDGPAPTIEFTPVGIIVPEMTVASGGLNTLSINGRPIDMGSTYNSLRGGSLAALFHVRDDIAVEAQADLDAFARDLIERFQDPSIDPTLSSGQPGLFTDAGTTFTPANETALSSRLALNPLVDPGSGGALWRIRDGLGAAAPGNVGNSALLQSLSDALSQTRIPASGSFAGASRTSPGLAADFLSSISSRHQAIQSEVLFSEARQKALKTKELETGVDTDQEMQHLLLAEQAFSANARVIQTADDLIQTLLRM